MLPYSKSLNVGLVEFPEAVCKYGCMFVAEVVCVTQLISNFDLPKHGGDGATSGIQTKLRGKRRAHILAPSRIINLMHRL